MEKRNWSLFYKDTVEIRGKRKNCVAKITSDGRAIVKPAGRKISKIRWCTHNMNSVFGRPAETFVFGGYDEENNKISLCKLSLEDDIQEPVVLDSVPYAGDVADISFLKMDHFIATSSHGNAIYYEVVNEDMSYSLVERFKWEKLHFSKNSLYPSSCTTVDCLEDFAITGGEDGKLNVLNLNEISKKPLREIQADSSTLNCVKTLKFNECATAGAEGQIKLWDLRERNSTPTDTLRLTKTSEFNETRGYAEINPIAATCLEQHPTQKFILLSGDESGTLTFWDLRQTGAPMTILCSHQSSVSEAHFHPLNPNHLFTCSAAGNLWQWNSTKCNSRSENDIFAPKINATSNNPWLAISDTQKQPVLTPLMQRLHVPINTLAVSSNIVLCGADDETIYICCNIKVPVDA